MTYATAGAVARLGCNITGFGTAPLSATAVGQKTRKKVELYVFAGADGRAVLQNIFIRGGNSRIEQKPFVVDVRTGLSARYRSVRFTYNYVRCSREFTSPAGFPEGTTSARSPSRGSRHCMFSWGPAFGVSMLRRSCRVRVPCFLEGRWRRSCSGASQPR